METSNSNNKKIIRLVSIKMDNRNRNYTEEEEMYIERSWGKVSTSRIAKKLNRSESAIKIKAHKMKLGSLLNNKDYLINSEIANILGVDKKTTKGYRDKRNMPMKERNLTKTKKVLAIEYENFIDWLRDNTDIWDSTKADRISLELLGYDSIELQKKINQDEKILSRKTLSDKDIEKIIKYHKQCYKYRDIADLMGKDYQIIKWKIHTLIRAGKLDINNKKGKILRNVNRENYGWTENQDNILIKQFREGKSLREISEIVGKSLSATKSRHQLLTKRIMNGLSI